MPAQALVVSDGSRPAPNNANSTNNVESNILPSDPGFANVGTFTEGDNSLTDDLGSGVYLGNGKVLTDQHVLSNFPVNTFCLSDGTSYSVVPGSAQPILDSSNNGTDMAVVTLATSPVRPTLTLAAQTVQQQQLGELITMISFGDAGSGGYANGGLPYGGPVGELWGNNSVSAGDAQNIQNTSLPAIMFATTFNPFIADSAQVETGDSGGAAFYYDAASSQWLLRGLIWGRSQMQANYATSGDQSLMIDLANYTTQIDAAAGIPEPGSLLLLAVGGCTLALGRRRR
jgi:hypothetical protein